jgi:hypothetical protein
MCDDPHIPVPLVARVYAARWRGAPAMKTRTVEAWAVTNANGEILTTGDLDQVAIFKTRQAAIDVARHSKGPRAYSSRVVITIEVPRP